MKQWTEHELTLFYYDELPQQVRTDLLDAMSNDDKLAQQYTQLSDFLDQQLTLEVPPPSEQLDQRIMAGIYQQVEKDLLDSAASQNRPAKVRFWSNWQWGKIVGTAVPICFVALGTFYLGRLSVDNEPLVANNTGQTTIGSEQNLEFDTKQVLVGKLSQHLQSTDRLLTQVSNSDTENSMQIEQRHQAIEDLVALNRLYRRVAEQNGDKQLAHMLQQMEQILLSLKNTSPEQQPQQWEHLRSRIDDSDLLFRMRVTEKTLQSI